MIAGECKPPSLCVGLSDAQLDSNTCQLEDATGEAEEADLAGVCCSDLSEQDQAGAADRFKEQNLHKEEEEQQEVDSVSVDDVDSLIGERYNALLLKIY